MILFFARHESSLKQMIELMEYLQKFSADKKIFVSGNRKLKTSEKNFLKIKKNLMILFKK